MSHKVTTTRRIGNGGTGSVTLNIRESSRIFKVTGPNIEYGKFIAKFVDIPTHISEVMEQNIKYRGRILNIGIAVLSIFDIWGQRDT